MGPHYGASFFLKIWKKFRNNHHLALFLVGICLKPETRPGYSGSLKMKTRCDRILILMKKENTLGVKMQNLKVDWVLGFFRNETRCDRILIFTNMENTLGVKIRNLKVDFKTGGTWCRVGEWALIMNIYDLFYST